jgi:hypothetical protein
MRTMKVKVYKYGELSEKARQSVRDHAAEAWGFTRNEEYLASIKALAEHFGGKVSDYNIDWFGTARSSMSFEMPYEADMPTTEISRRLKALGSYNRKTLKGNGDCKLTGWCYDESAIDGFRIAFMRGKICNPEELMQAAFRTWLEDAREDCAYDYSDEGYAETAEANGWEYYDNGEVV